MTSIDISRIWAAVVVNSRVLIKHLSACTGSPVLR